MKELERFDIPDFYADDLMKLFTCDYCQQNKPTKGQRRLHDFDHSRLYYCADCMHNPMAKRRMKIVALKHKKVFWDNFDKTTKPKDDLVE